MGASLYNLWYMVAGYLENWLQVGIAMLTINLVLSVVLVTVRKMYPDSVIVLWSVYGGRNVGNCKEVRDGKENRDQ